MCSTAYTNTLSDTQREKAHITHGGLDRLLQLSATMNIIQHAAQVRLQSTAVRITEEFTVALIQAWGHMRTEKQVKAAAA